MDSDKPTNLHYGFYQLQNGHSYNDQNLFSQGAEQLNVFSKNLHKNMQNIFSSSFNQKEVLFSWNYFHNEHIAMQKKNYQKKIIHIIPNRQISKKNHFNSAKTVTGS